MSLDGDVFHCYFDVFVAEVVFDIEDVLRFVVEVCCFPVAEAREKEGRSHPDFQYTAIQWRFLLSEERRKSEAINKFLRKAPSAPKWLKQALPRRRDETRPPTQKSPHTIKNQRTSGAGALKVITVCSIVLILGGAIYLNWDKIAPRIKLPDITLPGLSDAFPSQEVNIAEVEMRIFTYINEERASQGLPRLQEDPNLVRIASQWSEHLATTGQVTHGNFEERIASIAYSYYLCGEIIAIYGGYNSDLARQFVDMWMGSTGHYEIMITPRSGYMGVGVSDGVDGFYAVVDFRFN